MPTATFSSANPTLRHLSDSHQHQQELLSESGSRESRPGPSGADDKKVSRKKARRSSTSERFGVGIINSKDQQKIFLYNFQRCFGISMFEISSAASSPLFSDAGATKDGDVDTASESEPTTEKGSRSLGSFHHFSLLFNFFMPLYLSNPAAGFSPIFNRK